MIKRAGLLFSVGLGLIGLTGAAFAGAWTLDANTGALFVTGTAMQANTAFDGNNRLRSIPRYSKDEAQALIEYGVTNWFTAIFQPSLQHVDIAAPFNSERSGLGYTDIGGRVRLWSNGSWVVSAQTIVSIPAARDSSNLAAIGYTDRQVDVRGLVGYSFKAGTLPAFVDLQIAQRFRLGGPPNEFRTDATFGIRPAEKWLLLLQSFNVVSEGTGTWGFASYNYHKLQLSAVYALTPKLSLQLGGYSSYWGRNALQENGLVVAAWYKF
jgi:hypothetical protein